MIFYKRKAKSMGIGAQLRIASVLFFCAIILGISIGEAKPLQVTQKSIVGVLKNLEGDCAGATAEGGQKHSTDPLINLVIYRSGMVAVTKKLLSKLKTGVQNIIYPHIPKTLNTASLMPLFEEDDSMTHILGQSVQNDDEHDTNTLLIEVLSPKDQTKVINLNYTFTGMDWDVFYVALIDSHQKSMTLYGWIELANHSGTTIENAQIIFEGGSSKMTADGTTFVRSAGDFRYVLPRVTTLEDGQKKHIVFLHRENIPLAQENILNVGGDALYDLRGDILSLVSKRSLSFQNTEDLGFSMTLPTGSITLYQKEDTGLTHLLGVTTLSETHFGERAFLQMEGNVYGGVVTAELEQTDFSKKSKRTTEAGYALHLQHKGIAPLQLKVMIPMEGAEGTIIRSTPVNPARMSTHYRGRAKGASDLHWDISLQPQQQFDLKYRLKREGSGHD